MGEEARIWKAYKRQTQALHRQWHKHNRAVLEESGLPYEDKGEVLLFREEGRPKADFYPSTGRWKVDNQMYRGGAQSFLRWYRRQ